MTEQTKLNTISCQGGSDNTFIISKSFTQFVSNLRSDIIEIHRRIIYMRKDLGDKMQFMPLPVLMLATYDQDGKANVCLLYTSTYRMERIRNKTKTCFNSCK